MPKAHPKSARPDSARSHRSQPKPTKGQPILLDRLDAALCRQNIVLKRSVLQLIAAEAFGFHNANEFAAADLVPPAAKVLGRVELNDARGLIVVEDPSLHAIFGLDEGFFREALATSRAAQYGISPYGDLVDLSGLLSDRRSGLPVAPTSAVMSHTDDPFHLYAGETVHFVRIEIDPDHPVLFIDLTRQALDDTVAQWCRENWATGANAEIDPATLNNANAVLLAFFAGELRDRLIYAETKLPSPPRHIDGINLKVWTAHHGDAESHRIYVDATEVGLHAQIRELLISLLEESDDEVDFDADDELSDLVALYERHSTMRITFGIAMISLPGGSLSTPLPSKVARRDGATNLDWLDAVASGETTLGEDDWRKATEQKDRAAVLNVTADTAEARSIDQMAATVQRWTQKARDDLANDAEAYKGNDHPVYRRADWELETELGITKYRYGSWVKHKAQQEILSQQKWLRADRHNTVFGQRVAQGCDVILQIPCLIDGPDPIVRQAGDLVRLRDWKVNDLITVEIAPGILVPFRSEDRDGLFPVSIADKGAAFKDLHPVYIRKDWVAAHSQDPRVGQYETWLRNQIARNTLATETWWHSSSGQPTTSEKCPWTIQVHGLATLESDDGLPPRRIPYAPGDRVKIFSIGMKSDHLATLGLYLEKGGVIRLNAEDRMNYFPISPVTPAKANPDFRFYPAADWIAEARATSSNEAYQAWAEARVARDAVCTEWWMTLTALRAAPASIALEMQIHHPGTVRDVNGECTEHLCEPGDRVWIAGIDDRTDDVSVTFAFDPKGSSHTGQRALFTVKLSDRGGYVPVRPRRGTGISLEYAGWLNILEQELEEPTDPALYKEHFGRGFTPAEAVSAVRHENGLDPEDVGMTPDVFLWAVADEIGRRDLTHDAAFQEFCANMHGLATPAQAAESWDRR